MLEIARAFSQLIVRGWKPKRTLRIASWDAEEFGLIGSSEWVEDHLSGSEWCRLLPISTWTLQ